MLEPGHGLIVQSYRPRRQAHGRMNAYGWRAGFFAAGRPEPARWLLSHNGVADRSILGPHPHAESACDFAQLAAHLFGFGPERAGEFVRDLGKRNPDARLNLLLTDGRRIIATRWNDTLSIPRTGGGGVASEPYYDDPVWADVPDHHLVDVAGGVVTVTELEA